MDWADNDDFKKNQTVPDSCCIDASKPNCAGKVLKTNNTKNIHDEVHAQIRLLVQKVDKTQLCYRASSRGVHGNGEDWDPMGPMGFPWEWE